MLFGTSRVMQLLMCIMLCYNGAAVAGIMDPPFSYFSTTSAPQSHAATRARDDRNNNIKKHGAVRFCRPNRYSESLCGSCYVSRTRRHHGDCGHFGHMCRSVEIIYFIYERYAAKRLRQWLILFLFFSRCIRSFFVREVW